MSVGRVGSRDDVSFAAAFSVAGDREALGVGVPRVVTADVSRKSGLSSQGSSVRARLEQQAQKLEEIFVKKCKTSLLDAFGVWYADFEPNAAYGLSYIPAINAVVQKESKSTIKAFLDGVQASGTRRKIAKLISEELKVIENGRIFVDQATSEKLDEAVRLLREKLAQLDPIPTKTTTTSSAREFPKVRGEGDLYQRKQVVYGEMLEWKASFKVVPTYLFSYVPGAADVLQAKADDIFAYFVKQISHAANAAEFRAILEQNRERMLNFRVFVDAETAVMVDRGIQILTASLG